VKNILVAALRFVSPYAVNPMKNDTSLICSGSKVH